MGSSEGLTAITTQTKEAGNRLAWVLVGYLWVAYFLNYLDRQLVFSMFPALKRELHFTDAQLGLVGTVFLWVYGICIGISGRVADVVPRERIVVISLVLWSLATLGTALSNSVFSFLAWRAIMGVTESLYVPAAVGLIAALHPGVTRSRALSIHSTAQFMGIAVSGGYGGWMADHVGWRYGFLVLGVIGTGYALILGSAFAKLGSHKQEKIRIKASPGDIFRSHCYLAHAFAFFFFLIILWMLYAWLPTLIYERFQLSMAESGFTATVYLQTSSAVGVLAGGVAGDWFVKRIPSGRFYLGSIGLLLCAPCAYLTLAVSSLGLLKLCAVGFGLFAGLMVANNFACAYDVIAERNYGFGAGFLNLIAGLAAGGATFLAGLWKQSIGIPTLMAWAVWAAVLGAVVQVVVAAMSFRRDRLRLETAVDK